MKRGWMLGLAVIVIVLLGGLFAITTLAPDTSGVLTGDSEAVRCLTDEVGACLVMPRVTGIDVNSEVVSFPDAFDADYQLVVMPFDQDQQARAIEWYVLFQDLAADDERVNFWSIAALPELNAAIRVLVIGGIRAGVSDADVRARIGLLFLEDQAAFLDALAIPDTDAIRVFIMDREGTVLHVTVGDYNEETDMAFSEALAQVLGDDDLAE